MTSCHSAKLARRIGAVLLLGLLVGHPAYGQEGPAQEGPGQKELGNGFEASMPSLAPLVRRLLPSVVAVASSKRVADDPSMDPGGGFPDLPLPQELNVVGSGVVVDADLGLVVTANHVIDNAEAVAVTLFDGRKLGAAVLAASEADDLAVLKITATGLTSLPLGHASSLEIGDFVLAIGSPLGLGQSTTFGIVSALHRPCPGIDNADMIMTDALIERGNSGGPLINLRGEVVGINVARIGRSDLAGFGFAVPADAIRRLLARARPSG